MRHQQKDTNDTKLSETITGADYYKRHLPNESIDVDCVDPDEQIPLTQTQKSNNSKNKGKSSKQK